jgi:hypothetical protein
MPRSRDSIADPAGPSRHTVAGVNLGSDLGQQAGGQRKLNGRCPTGQVAVADAPCDVEAWHPIARPPPAWLQPRSTKRSLSGIASAESATNKSGVSHSTTCRATRNGRHGLRPAIAEGKATLGRREANPGYKSQRHRVSS